MFGHQHKKTSQLLVYLTQHHGDVSITSLMKLAYLVDLISAQKRGKKISDFKYIRYNYGPFDPSIYKIVDELVQNNVIIASLDYKGTEEYVAFTFNEKFGDYSFDELAADEIEIIDEVLNTVKGYGARVLTEIAYKTKPMAKLGATLGGQENLHKELDLFAQ